MLIQLLRVKIQQLIVSESSVSYPGSIALPDELIEASGLKLFELVHVNNVNNGSRIITYVVRSKKKGYVSLNGAASKHFVQGDTIHVLSYAYVTEQNAVLHEPKIIYTDADNCLVEVKTYTF
jgi:aspartate 1-decarboxylase